MAVSRDANGRVLPGSTLNGEGRNQYKGNSERLSAQARTLLDRSATTDELAALGLSEAARGLLPENGATLEQALLAAMFTDALRGDAQARRDLLARVWPAPKPVEVSAGEGVGRTLVDLLKSAREETERESRVRDPRSSADAQEQMEGPRSEGGLGPSNGGLNSIQALPPVEGERPPSEPVVRTATTAVPHQDHDRPSDLTHIARVR